MPRISLEKVSVFFPVYAGGAKSIRSSVVSFATGGRVSSDKTHAVVVQALNEVDLELRTGDRLALIGHNGSGKSTILRTLAGIYRPTAGRVTVEGRVAPLLDIWSGMDFDATGEENIELRGLCLGLSRTHIRTKLQEIADFAELGDFMGLPIRTYSAGMLTRLAFAVSTAVEPDVLLIDESIGAGDAAFLERAARRLRDFVDRSGILVFASHSDALVREFCNKAIWMHQGKIIQAGGVDEIIAAYHHAIEVYRQTMAQSG